MRHKKQPLDDADRKRMETTGNTVGIGTDVFLKDGKLIGERPLDDEGKALPGEVHMQLNVWPGEVTLIQPVQLGGEDNLKPYGEPYKYNGLYDEDFTADDLKEAYRQDNVEDND